MACKRKKTTNRKKGRNFATNAFEDTMMAFPEIVGAAKRR